jgi:hypothetical protein
MTGALVYTSAVPDVHLIQYKATFVDDASSSSQAKPPVIYKSCCVPVAFKPKLCSSTVAGLQPSVDNSIHKAQCNNKDKDKDWQWLVEWMSSRVG